MSGTIQGGQPPFTLTVDGIPVSPSGLSFTYAAALPEGRHRFEVEVVDALGRSARASRTVDIDRTPPTLTLLRPLANPATATQTPLLIEGLAGDLNLSRVEVAGTPVPVLAGRFTTAVPLVAGTQTIRIIAYDAALNTSTVDLVVEVSGLPPSVAILEPLDGSEAPSSTVTVVAQVNATTTLDEVRIGTGLGVSDGNGRYRGVVALALGDNVITVTAKDALGRVGTDSVSVHYRDAATEPLRVIAVSPSAAALGVEPDSLVTITFNKPVEPQSLQSHFTLTSGGQSVEGGFSTLKGSRTVSFVARAPLPQGDVRVRVDGVLPLVGPGLAAPFTSQFSVRAPLTELSGDVIDEDGISLKGLRIEVEGHPGLTTLTAPNGNYSLLLPGAGTYTLRFTGGVDSRGRALPTVRRKHFAQSEHENLLPTLILTPVDTTSAQSLDGALETTLTFQGQHPGLSITLPAGALTFEDGTSRGTVTLTRLSSAFLPVPTGQREGPQHLWHLQPAATRLTAQPTLKLPNLEDAPPGSYALVYGFDADALSLVRAAVARVDEDGLTLSLRTPFQASSLEFFGYSQLPSDSIPQLAQLLGETPPPSGGGDGGDSDVDGGLGLRLGPQPSLFERLMESLYATAWAQTFGLAAGIFTFMDTMLSSSAPAIIQGTVKAESDEPLLLTLLQPPLDGGFTLRIPVGQPASIPLVAQGTLPSGVAAPGTSAPTVAVSLSASHLEPDGGASAVSPGAGAQWLAEGAGLATLSTTVEMLPFSTEALVTVSTTDSSRALRLAAYVVPDSGFDGSYEVSVRLVADSFGVPDAGASNPLFATGLDGGIEPLVRFGNTGVQLTGVATSGATTNSAGVYSAALPLLMTGKGSEIACTQVPLAARTVVFETPGAPKRYETRQQVFSACSAPVTVTSGFTSTANVTVDVRMLYGALRFVDKWGAPLPLQCPGAGPLPQDGGPFVGFTPDDVDATEVHFFREDDLSIPIARFTTGAFNTGACDDGLPTGQKPGSYGLMRIGPRDNLKRTVQARCRSIEAAGKANAGDSDVDGRFYNAECRENRSNFLRLRPGDRLVAFAISHSSGFAGLARVTVPPINRRTQGCVDSPQSAVRVVENGQVRTISSCLTQELGIPLDIDLYPPEVEVRVARRFLEEGIPQASGPTLVRTGGAATSRDGYLAVSTHWRVRTAPLPPFDVNLLDGGQLCLHDGGSSADAGCRPSPLRDVGTKGLPLEVYCSQLPQDAGADFLAACVRDEELLDVPAGVPPLGARVALVSSGLATPAGMSPSFLVEGGRRTHWAEVAFVGASGTTTSLSGGNYYVHVVGRRVSERDGKCPAGVTPCNKVADGVLQDDERDSPPPDFTDGVLGPQGLPAKAITLKNVYRSLESQGRLERYDYAREHEFRLLELDTPDERRVYAQGTDGTERDLRDAGSRPSAQEGDVSYTLLTYLLEPSEPSRAGTLSGQYVVRLGSDDFGIDCGVTVDATTHRLSGTCGGEDIEEVLSAGDILYLELYLSGNAENVLYRFNFEGLKPRLDYVAATSSWTSAASTAKETVGQPPAPGRPVAQLPQAICTISPIDMRDGVLKVCTTSACAGADVVREAQVTYANGVYAATTLSGGMISEEFINDGPTGVEGAYRFRLKLPSHIAEMRNVPLSTATPEGVWCRLEPLEPDKQTLTKALGLPKGAYEGAHPFAAGQTTADGLNVTDGHLAFTHVDFAVPHLVGQWAFARTYNNQSRDVAPVGLGWHHNFEGELIQERNGRYVMLLQGQAYPFVDCPSPDIAQNPTGTCSKTDGTHGHELHFKFEGTQLVFTVQSLTGVRYRFAKNAERQSGIRVDKWLLTGIADGHESTEPMLPQTCADEWICLEYLPGSSLLATVWRQPGTLHLEFSYEATPLDAPGQVQGLARSENFKRLASVELREGATRTTPAGPRVQGVALKHSFVGGFNLVEVATLDGAPVKSWAYSYRGPQQSLSAGDVRWALTNELTKAEQSYGGAVVWRGEWPDRLSDIAGASVPGYDLVLAGQVVTSEVLPGQNKKPTKVDFTAPRVLRRHDGTDFTLTLNAYGSVTKAVGPRSDSSTDFVNDNPEEPVEWQKRTEKTGREVTRSFSPSNPHLVDSTTLTQLRQGSMPVDGIDVGKAFSTVTARAPRFNTPTTGTTPFDKTGQATRSRDVDPHGNVTRVAATHLGTDVFFGGAAYDSSGRLQSYIDEEGRTHTFTYDSSNRYGLPSAERIELAGAVGLAAVDRTLQYDNLGRLADVQESPTGHHSHVDYDAAGRMLRRTVDGTPGVDCTYAYAHGDNVVTITEECGEPGTPADARQRRTKTLEDGQLKAETRVTAEAFAASGGVLLVGQQVGQNYTYVDGLLDTATDTRGVTRKYHYDAEKRLQSVEVSVGSMARVEVEYVRDDDGNVESVKDHLGRVTTIARDGLGRAVKYDYGPAAGDNAALRDAVVTERDMSGGLLAKTVGKGHRYLATVDGLGRVRSLKSNDGTVDERRSYDSASRVTLVEDLATGATESFEYKDVLGRMTKLTRVVTSPTSAPLTLTESFTYDDTVSPRTVTVGRSIDTGFGQRQEAVTYTVDALGRRLSQKRSVSQAAITSTDFTYNWRGQLLTVTKPSGGQTSNTYDNEGRLVAIQDERKRMTLRHYDGEGLLVRQSGPHPQALKSYAYDAFEELTSYSERNEAGGTTTHTFAETPLTQEKAGWVETDSVTTRSTTRLFNARGRLLNRTLQDGNQQFTQTLEYDGDDVAARLSAEGIWQSSVTRTFDDRGRPKTEAEAWSRGSLGYAYSDTLTWTSNPGERATHQLSWSAPGAVAPTGVTTELDSLGNVVTSGVGQLVDSWRFDAAGALIDEKLSGKPSRRLAYDGSGFPRSSTYAPGTGNEVTSFEFDGDGRPTRVLEPSGRERSFTYAYGAQGGETVTEMYGELSSSFDITQTAFDATDEVMRVTRAAGTGDDAVWQYARGPRGLLTAVTQPTGGVFSYGWDGLGRLSSMTPPAGSGMKGETYGYDFLDRLSRRTRGTSTWSMPWTAGQRDDSIPESGVRKAVIDGRGREAFVQYQPGGRDAVTELTAMTTSYDGWNAQVRLDETRSDGNQTTSWLYDESHLLQSVTRGADVVGYGYAPPSRERRSITSPGGGASFEYDAVFERLQRVTDAHGQTTVTWEPGGERLLELNDGVIKQTHCYDERGRLSQAVAGNAVIFTCGSMLPSNALTAFEWTYDERGNRVTQLRQEGQSFSESRAWGYDLSDRLTSDLKSDGSGLSLQLNPDGTRHVAIRRGAGGAALEELEYLYDAQGALSALRHVATHAPAASFDVDGAGRRRGETRGAVTKTYGFDTGGRLVDGTVTGPTGGAQAHFRYDGVGRRRRAEVTLNPPTGPPDSFVSSWVFGGESGEELASESPRGVPQHYVSVAGLPLSSGPTRFATDALGSVVARHAPGVSEVTRYSAAGELEAGAPSTAQSSMAFAGGQLDIALGMQHHGQRWLDTATNSWLSEEPKAPGLEDVTARPPFLYASGAPSRLVDVDGREADEQSQWQTCLKQAQAHRGGFPETTCMRQQQAQELEPLWGTAKFRLPPPVESSRWQEHLLGVATAGGWALGESLANTWNEADDNGYGALAATLYAPVLTVGEMTGLRGSAEVILERDIVSGRALSLDEAADRGLSGGLSGLTFVASAVAFEFVASGMPGLKKAAFARRDFELELDAALMRQRMAREISGLRASPFNEVTLEQQALLKQQMLEIGGDPALLRFNEGSTGFLRGARPAQDVISVGGDVFPASHEVHPRSVMSSRAVLAHEFHGHRAMRNTTLPRDAWNDEFRASYLAATRSPSLTVEERAHLIADALSRANEAGQPIKPNALMRYLLYGIREKGAGLGRWTPPAGFTPPRPMFGGP